jgi:hypothetical protein
VTPNPVKDKIQVALSSNFEGEIRIVDLTGRIIYSELLKTINKKEFDFSSKANGVYFVKLIMNNTTVETVKLVVQH